ncbi:hypothetical protein T03_4207 [Trichinella britovi]|uniref:Uncharacterized protein n=1 Tax=Trichinella britovi TaxID=45882 RepID=A0A0V1D9U3_TRIBR|nr:hypothetical protein T03_4207 [Trichinella britovi]
MALQQPTRSATSFRLLSACSSKWKKRTRQIKKRCSFVPDNDFWQYYFCPCRDVYHHVLVCNSDLVTSKNKMFYAQEMANWPGQGDTLPLSVTKAQASSSSSSCEANLLQKCSTLTQMQQPLPNIQAVVAWIVLLNVLLLPLLHYLHVSELLETLFNGRPTTNPQLPLDEELQSGKDTQAGRQAACWRLALSKRF